MRPLAVFSVAVALIAVSVSTGSSGQAATTANVVIRFENLDTGGPGGSGSLVTVHDQYAKKGIEFNDPSAIDYSKGPFAIPNFAHSGTIGIEPCVAQEFCTAPIGMTFGTAQHHVKVWVGFSSGLSDQQTVVLKTYDANGTDVGDFSATLGPSSDPIPIQTPLKVNTQTDVIVKAEVTLASGFNNGLAVDDVEYDTAGRPPPCPAQSDPKVSLSQPRDNEVVQLNDFLLQGKVTSGDPFHTTTLQIQGAGQSVSGNLSTGTTTIGPTRVQDSLPPGRDLITVIIGDCKGIARASRHVIYSPGIPNVLPSPIAYGGSDPSPTSSNFATQVNHSPSGRILSLVASGDGVRLYAGTYAGVWRSDNAGIDWHQLTRPQPVEPDTTVAEALSVPTVFSLALSPASADVVFAATGPDDRNRSRAGVYRSTNGGDSWTLVHQFSCTSPLTGAPLGPVGQVVIAPDDANVIYAAGGCAVGISTDGGTTWADRPVPAGAVAWHLAVGPWEGSARRVYAAGNSTISYSTDSGSTWTKDQATMPPGFANFPSEAHGTGSDVLAVEPGSPLHVYLARPGLANGPSYYHPQDPDGQPPQGVACNTDPRRGCGEGSLWFGDFRGFTASNPRAGWSQLTGPPVYYGVADESGDTYVEVKPTSSGYLVFFSDGNAVHVSAGLPQPGSWHRLDGRDASQSYLDHNLRDLRFVHVDPHAIAMSSSFDITLKAPGTPSPYDRNRVLDQYIGGAIWMANDGGVYRSFNGGVSWALGASLSTLSPVGVGGVALPGQPPALYIGTGDNDNFFTLDGGQTWADPISGCGDCDPFFSDPALPNRVAQFAAREANGGFRLFTDPGGGYPNASNSADSLHVPCPASNCNANTGPFLNGDRPVLRTLAGELPDSDGDYLVIRTKSNGARALLRTTSISSIATQADWDNAAKAVQVGPDLPSLGADIAQAAGGHAYPTFFVAESGGRVWKWTSGMADWTQIVPGGPAGRSSQLARRFFVDPYDPDLMYIVDIDAVKRSDDGGHSWVVDSTLDRTATQAGEFAYGQYRGSVIQDIVFDRSDPAVRFAIGRAGVLFTSDGRNWYRMLSMVALPGQAWGTAYLDTVTDPSMRTLYVAFQGRGLLKMDVPTQTPRQLMGYVWADAPTAPSYTPDRSYQRNSSGALNTITRSGVGTYAVRFPNLGVAAGTVDVTAYGGVAEACKVTSWGSSGKDLLANVRCFAGGGAPADTLFTAAFVRLVGEPGDFAYVWTGGSAPKPGASATYQYNSTGAVNTVVRTGVGRYAVRLPGLGAPGGTVMVTAYGPGSERCHVLSWGPDGADQVVRVTCTSFNGTPVDTLFALSYGRKLAITGTNGARAASLLADQPTAASYLAAAPYSYNSTGGVNRLTRSGTGTYAAILRGLGGRYGHVQVTAYGNNTAQCKVYGWYPVGADLNVNVRCFGPTGAPVDARYVLNYAQ